MSDFVRSADFSPPSLDSTQTVGLIECFERNSPAKVFWKIPALFKAFSLLHNCQKLLETHPCTLGRFMLRTKESAPLLCKYLLVAIHRTNW